MFRTLYLCTGVLHSLFRHTNVRPLLSLPIESFLLSKPLKKSWHIDLLKAPADLKWYSCDIVIKFPHTFEWTQPLLSHVLLSCYARNVYLHNWCRLILWMTHNYCEICSLESLVPQAQSPAWPRKRWKSCWNHTRSCYVYMYKVDMSHMWANPHVSFNI